MPKQLLVGILKTIFLFPKKFQSFRSISLETQTLV